MDGFFSMRFHVRIYIGRIMLQNKLGQLKNTVKSRFYRVIGRQQKVSKISRLSINRDHLFIIGFRGHPIRDYHQNRDSIKSRFHCIVNEISQMITTLLIQ